MEAFYGRNISNKKNQRKILVRCSALVGSYVQRLHTRVPSLSFFKTNLRISRTSFSENTLKKLYMFFTQDGPEYGSTSITGYLRRKHNIVIAEKRVDTTLSMVLYYRALRKTSTTTTTRTVNRIP